MRAINPNWWLVVIISLAMIIALGSGWGCNGSSTGGCRENIDCEASEYCEKETGDCGGEGECLPMPEFCPDVWDPVCGCDGETYGNACEAMAAGVNLSIEGQCPPPPCTDNDDCLTGEFCGKDISDCGGEGECLSKPIDCFALYDPVCGCDGNNYSNECYAQAAGVNVAHKGECPVPPCTQNSNCALTEYCEKIVGDCDGVGECVTMPAACPDVWDPVCGCDGETYGNECEAAAAGINVGSEGECAPVVCTDNSACTAAEYCGKATGDCDGTGTCLPVPTGCIILWNPVCGCDGKTYGNACESAAASVNVAAVGECP